MVVTGIDDNVYVNPLVLVMLATVNVPLYGLIVPYATSIPSICTVAPTWSIWYCWVVHVATRPVADIVSISNVGVNFMPVENCTAFPDWYLKYRRV